MNQHRWLTTASRAYAAFFAIVILSGCVASTTQTGTAPIVGAPQNSSSMIRIEAPSFVENPDIVPFSIQLSEPLREGDSLIVYIDENVAYRIEVKEDVQVDMFSGRVRSIGGDLQARVTRTNGQVHKARFSIQQNHRSSIPDLEDRGTEYRQAASRGEIRAIFNNYMGSRGFIQEIHIDSENGSIVIETSPYVSTNPFIWIQGNFQNASIRSVALHTSSDDVPSPAVAPRPSDIQSVSTGTAWLTPFGVFVTNEHVIRGAQKVTIIAGDGAEIAVSVIASDKEIDLALLAPVDRDQIRDMKGIPISSVEARIGTDVFTIGFPVTGLLGTSPRLTSGIVSASGGLGDDIRHYQITVPLQPGNSGGPLFNKTGEAVGIVTATLSPSYMQKMTGTLPQNVNFAVKSGHLDDLMRDIGASSPVNVLPRDAGSLEDLVDRVRGSIVYVIAR